MSVFNILFHFGAALKRAWSGSDHGGLLLGFFALIITKVAEMEPDTLAGLGAM